MSAEAENVTPMTRPPQQQKPKQQQNLTACDRELAMANRDWDKIKGVEYYFFAESLAAKQPDLEGRPEIVDKYFVKVVPVQEDQPIWIAKNAIFALRIVRKGK